MSTMECNHDEEHDCNSCENSDANGVCTQGHSHSHGHAHINEDEMTVKQFLQLNFKQIQIMAAKLEKTVEKLEKAGNDEAAKHVKNSIQEMEKSNMWIGVAMSAIEE